MQTKLLLRNPKKYVLLFTSLLLLSAIPYFAGSGLDDPEPMGSYLNSNFPQSLPEGLPYEPIFPNISFDSPLTFNELPSDDKIIVGQRDGRIFWFDKTPNVSTKNVVLDLSEKVGVVWDGGFLGLALHPEFGTSGHNYFYVYYTTEDANSNDFPNSYTTQSCNSEEYWGNFLLLARYEMDPDTLSVEESSEQVLLKLRMYGTTHRGGGLLFGDDGFLYLTTGDQTAFKKAQDIVNNLDGGVLRLDVDKDSTKSHPPVRTMPDDHGFLDEITGNGYWIPNDNPFLSPTGENFEEYYSMGHRNPHRMTKDRATGELYIGEIGGGRHEEINIVKKGKNFGWPLYEGFYQSTFCVQNLYNDMPHEQPLLAFPRAEANAIIGGYVYRGNEVPELQGKYICADYGNGEEIFTVDINTGAYQQYGNFTSTNVISFGEDKQGELYILKQGTSSLFKITSKNTGFGNTPQFLSQTGAFTDLINLTPANGLVPYDLVESFWSDGALKKRWMAIPNDGSHNTASEKITYSDIDDWDYPIGSVLIKHFELPINENNPMMTKRLETRFSIKAVDGNFYFVTYKWNVEQTDAELLTSGLDESINILKADGSTDTQTWSYPSTIDCVTCHNPTTGGAVGTKARYLNKDFTYSKTGRTANQLVTLSHLGILDQTITDADTNIILTSNSINDPTASIDNKARSYLDLNCAYCHRPGTGNRGDFDLRLNLDIVQTGILTASPYLPLGIPNEKIVDPGKVETSILYHRINTTDPVIRMPPIAKNKLDVTAVQLIYDWINLLDPEPCTDRIIMETFDNVPGTTLAELRSNVNFPDAPAAVNELDEFRIPINVGDDYGMRVKGLLRAPETGTYYFWVTGDDNVELSLSSDINEANKNRIAYHDNWSLDGEWNKYPTQKSAGINLVAGQNYYIEALMNERGGGDNLSVGWRKPSNGDGTVPFQVIPCTAFDYFNGPPVVNVTGVSLDLAKATITEGNTQQLTATVAPVDATDQGVGWGSDDTNVATVDANGLVTAVAVGTATITATTTDGSFTDTSVITVEAAPIAVTGVSLDLAAATVTEGDTQQLTATVAPVDATDQGVGWGSDDTNVATVDANGLVTAVAVGTATITATTTDGSFTDTSVITVEAAPIAVTGVGLALATATITEGNTQQLTATVAPVDATDQGVGWGSDDTNVATVDGNGLVTAVSVGTVTITVTTTDGGFTATSAITVEAAPIAVTGVGLDLATATITEGNTQQLTATVAPVDATDQGVGWGSDDTNVATVDGNGLVTAVSVGTVTITVTTTDGGFEVSSLITVESATIDVTGVNVSPLFVTITAGSTQQLTATVAPVDATDQGVGWGSDDTNVATVDGTGLVTAVAVGTATITATTTDGSFTATCTITVEAAPIVVTGVGLDPDAATLVEGATLLLLATVSPTDASDPSVIWSSSDSAIATVTTGGLVTAVAEGTATITATTTDGGFEVSSLITVESATIDVTGVNVSPLFVTITAGSTQQLTATVAPVDATDQGVGWGSDDITVATVDANGLVTAVAEGTATITATTTDGGFEVSSLITVESATIDVTGVNVSPLFVTITAGSTQQLTATVAPVDATDQSVGWGSEDTNVATVDGTGLVTAVLAGTATITATTTDGGFTASSTIIVEDGCTLSNVALGGTATQSSTYGNGQASLAIDGNTTGSSPWSADLQHTANENAPWWELDLGADHTIDNLNIFNRSDKFQSRLNNFYVFVSAAPFAPGASLADLLADTSLAQYYFAGEAGLQETIAFDAEGRYVRIQLSGSGILHMAEVEVMGCFLQASPCAGEPTVTITPSGPYLDTDPVQNLVGSPVGGTWSGASTDGTFDPGIGAGTYSVTYTYDNGLGCIQSDTRDIVVNTTGTGGCILTNVALGGTATQSSTYGNGQASLAIDGNTTGSSPWSADLQHTANENAPWWELDLGADHTIDNLNIFNRSDKFQSRLNNFYVFVSAAPFAPGASLADLLADTSLAQYYFAGEAGLQETIAFDAEGRYVRIQLSGSGILHMAEVEVMGCFLQASPCAGEPTVTITPSGPYLDTDPVQNLVGSPVGGTWSGASTDGTFDPGIGAGTYSVTYTYDNGLGCIQSDTRDIVVNTTGTGGCILTNVALGGTATQSSTYGNGQASLAIDGNTTGSSPWSADLQHTANENTPWWELDLGADHTIDNLNIFNRSNKFQSRLNNFYVFVSAAPFAPGASLADLLADTSLAQYYFAGEAGLQETIAFDAEGRYVRIQLSGSGILHMAEVEVMGCPVVGGSTSLKAYVSPSSSLTLSPVPVSTILNIDYFFANDAHSAIELSIFDNIGRQIQSRTLTSDTFNGQLNVSQLTPGVYLLRLQKEDDIIIKRFTVIR